TQNQNVEGDNKYLFGETGIEFFSGSTINGGATWCVGKILGVTSGQGVISTGDAIFRPSVTALQIDLRGGLAFYCSPSSKSSLPNETDQIEVMRIVDNKVGVKTKFPLGQLDVNVGIGTEEEIHKRAKISLTSGTTIADPTYQPQIRLYSPSGVSWTPTDRETSYSWYIQSLRQYNSMCFAGLDGVIHNDNNTTQGALHFRAGYNPATPAPGDLYSSDMGTENTVARMSLLSNGNVGINSEVPMCRFTVNNGAVLFEGEQGATPLKREYHTMGAYYSAEEIGAGTRMMWIPEKAAFRAGRVDTNQWNSTNIGQNSVAIGYDCKATAISSISMGEGNRNYSYAGVSLGRGNQSDTINEDNHGSITIGHTNFVYGIDGVGLGFNNTNYGHYSQTLGNTNNCNINANYSSLIGNNNTITPLDTNHNINYSIAMGYGNYLSSSNSIVLGKSNATVGDNSAIIGTLCRADTIGAFCIGIGYGAFPLTNDKPNSLMVSFNTNIPTFFIGSANGPNTLGKIGVGTSNPGTILGVNGTVSIGWNGTQIQTDTNVQLQVERRVVIGGTSEDTSGTSTNKFLTVYGDAIKTIGGAHWDIPSDENLKKNISFFTDGLEQLRHVNPIWFEYNGKYGFISPHPEIGVLAQDIQQVLPYTVKEDTVFQGHLIKAEQQYIVIENDTLSIELTDSLGRESIQKKIIPRSYRRTIPAEYETIKNPILTYNPNGLMYVMVNAIKSLDSSVIKDRKKNEEYYIEIEKIRRENSYTIDSLKKVVETMETRLARLEVTNNINLEEFPDIILEQNNPNPFSESAKITYYIPEKVNGDGKLLIVSASMMSDILRSIDLIKGMPQQVTIDATDLKTGVYIYTLTVGGKIAATKKMIIIK
ncbi:MAG: tail fiber domain-containing protein, partial [Bacteroidetes bacterium]|nr:tail fiber domain-containing protein [Bacteroidota bacterium]